MSKHKQPIIIIRKRKKHGHDHHGDRRIEQEMAAKSAEFADAGNRVYLPIDATSGAASRS